MSIYESLGVPEIKDPKTLLKDYDAYCDEVLAINKKRESGEITEAEYETGLGAIEKKHKGVTVFPEDDCYVFDDFSAFRRAVMFYFTDDEKASEAIRHEREHYEGAKAADPDADLSYTIWALKNDDGSTVQVPAVMVGVNEGEGDKHLKIRKASMEAVSEPSEFDKKELED